MNPVIQGVTLWITPLGVVRIKGEKADERFYQLQKVFHSCHVSSWYWSSRGHPSCGLHTGLESLTTFSPRATVTNSQKALDGTVSYWSPQLLVLSLASRRP